MQSIAWLGILLYPVGISVVYAVLLLAARPALVQEKPTALSKALGFLVRDFDVQFMWWELLMAWRQLWLVGFAVLIAPGGRLLPLPPPPPPPQAVRHRGRESQLHPLIGGRV